MIIIIIFTPKTFIFPLIKRLGNKFKQFYNKTKEVKYMLHRRILAINDISGLGQCSLSAAIPIINAFGFETVSLPTAILTNQTGYESFYMFDCTDLIPHFIEEWKKLNLHFETVYTGFFASEKQIDLIIELINNFKSSINKIIVDHIIADSGKVYIKYTKIMLYKIYYLT